MKVFLTIFQKNEIQGNNAKIYSDSATNFPASVGVKFKYFLEEWSEWSECDSWCGQGSQVRSKMDSKGQPTGTASETQTCEGQALGSQLTT